LHKRPYCAEKPEARGNRLGSLGLRREALRLPKRPTTDRGFIVETARRKLGSEQALILFAPLLFAESLPRKGFLRPALLAGFHVEAMLLDFLDDVFLLHLALETPQCIFQ